MKKLLLLFCFAFALGPVWAQKGFPHNLKDLVFKIKTDTLVGIIPGLTSSYVANHPDSGIYYAKELITYGRQNNDRHILASGLNIYSYALYNKGNYPVALNLAFQSLKIIENSTYTRVLAGIYNLVGNIYKGQQNYPKALYYYRRGKQAALVSHNGIILSASYFNIAFVFKETNVLDSALYYSGLAVKDNNDATDQFMGYILSTLGDEHLKLKNYKKALEYYLAAYRIDQKNADFRDASITCISLSKYYTLTGKPDSSIYYAQQSLRSAKRASYNKSVFESAALLARLYETRRQPDSGFKYLKLSTIAKDSLYNAAKSGEIENLTTNEFLRQNEIQAAQKAYQNKLKLYALIFGLLVLLIAALLQWRNSRQRKKAYILLQKQKEEIEEQKAQAMIEVALERVRAKTMAMQKSDELLETSEVLFQQLRDLGETADQTGIAIVNEQEGVFELFATIYGNQMIQVFRPKIDDPFVMSKVYKAWKAKEKSFVIEIAGEELRSYNTMRNKLVGAYYNEDISAEDRWVVTAASFSKGILSFSSSKRPPKETSILLERFAAVFDSTYTRFLDLQKAEAQAREANIEAALERVRTKTMAMHNSQDVADTVVLMFDELVKLGIEKNVRCGIGILDDTEHIELWTAFNNPEGQVSLIIGSLDMTIHPLLRNLYNAWKNKEDQASYEMAGDDLIAYYQAINDAPDYPTQFDMALLPAKQFHYDFFFPEGTIFAFSPGQLTPEATQIFKRFTGVFGLTYRRYLDLLKAEGQAKEAKIEVALERVRSRTMAMQKSDELVEVIQVIYDQLLQLNFNINSANFALDYKESDDFNLWISSAGQSYPTKIHIPYLDLPIYNRFIEAKENEIDFLAEIYSFEEKNAFFKHFFKHVPGVSEERKEFVFNAPGYARSTVLLKNITLTMQNYAAIPYSDEQNATLRRFGKVFEQTYTRFNDLQQAEAQAREAKIETGLERVRVKAMSMQTSEELNELIGTVFGELTKLDVVLTRCLIMIFDPETKASRWWMANSEAPSEPMNYLVQYHKHDAYASYIKAWQERILNWRYALKGKVKKTWDDFLFTETELSRLPAPVIAGMKAPQQVILSASFNNFGCMTLVTLEPLSDEHFELLLRFAKVFDMSYTRFNDLKQAEAQAREARIEAALERVRSKTMAMHNSGDIENTAITMFDELVKLGVESTIRCGISIIHHIKQMELWTTASSPDGTATLIKGYLDLTMHPLMREVYEAWKKGEMDFSYVLVGDDLINYYQVISEYPDYPFEYKALPERRFHNAFFFPEGMLYAFTDEPLSAEVMQLLKRFAGVFGLTYRRFLDLQKAEAQAREAKIETSLERVRAEAMAMHDSRDVGNATALVFSELYKLGISTIRCGVVIIEESTKLMEVWSATSPGEGKVDQGSGRLDMTTHPLWQDLFDTWKQKKSTFTYELAGQDLLSYYKAISSASGYDAPEIDPSYIVLDDISDARQYCSCFLFAEGGLFTFTKEPFPPQESKILEKFAAVFSLTYRRYLDLKQAEEQARDAQIETALEKVRGKAMAMYNSKDLSTTASMVFTELRKLGINPLRCGVGIASKDSPKVQLYSATASAEGDNLALMGWVMLTGHPVLENIRQSILNNEDYFPVLKGKQLKLYYEELLSGLSLPSIPDWETGNEQYGHFFPFQDGCLYAWSEKPYPETDIKILKRFASVIDLTFRRYLELQKSEASARGAVRQASLDRVRAEIASMRSTSDLQSITPLVWNELTTLGVPFIRCGVFIVDEQREQIHSYLSTPDGKAIAAFQLGFNTDEIAKTVLANWRNKQFVTVHWNEEEFKRLSVELVSQGAVGSEEEYLTAHPPTSLDLHFFPFLQGMLYVGNITLLNDDEINLVQSLADAFSTAYARYEDFNKLEAAKKEVEQTLTGLKAAQTQLIQSEKMASLGELTAGIAHEIQNPLNFVNNFSEVNQEMIDELKEELKGGNLAEAMAIADSIRQNEEKINHHGKRADFIVKGMLQHSRTSTGEKQLANINVLADEFIKLSYHGLRAKDKSFNAEMISHFDPDLPKINMVQQDIGRVLLNLFNNAFYAVNQRQKSAGKDYKPEVIVSTLSENGHVTIKVKDNGTGIPDPIKDKIMQPFFTTKPTGEGTGLGLSLSYDMVVKGHGGTININSSEGEGSEFIVVLPV